MDTMFKSKRDTWIVVLIWAGALIAIFGAVEQFSTDAPLLPRAGMLVLLGSAAAVMIWILYSTDYTISEQTLLIRCGPFRYRVPLLQIDSVKPSRNPLSSPACSLDRLLIKWDDGRKKVLISPSRKREFLQELIRRCSQLKPEGDGLARRATE